MRLLCGSFFVCLHVRVGSRNLVSVRVDVCVFVLSGVHNGCDVRSSFYYYCGRFLHPSLCAPSQVVVLVHVWVCFLAWFQKNYAALQIVVFLCLALCLLSVWGRVMHVLHCCWIVVSHCVFFIPCLGVPIRLLISDWLSDWWFWPWCDFGILRRLFQDWFWYWFNFTFCRLWFS